MARNWRRKRKERGKRSSWLAFVQSYFKLPYGSKETRSIAELQRAVGIDLARKGKSYAKKVLKRKGLS